jgi:hypothetical protein
MDAAIIWIKYAVLACILNRLKSLNQIVSDMIACKIQKESFRTYLEVSL